MISCVINRHCYNNFHLFIIYTIRSTIVGYMQKSVELISFIR